MRLKINVWALHLVFIAFIPSLFANADIGDSRWSLDPKANHRVLGLCNWQMGSPTENDMWFVRPQIKAPDGLDTPITWGFVTEWYAHFKILHDRIENLHLSEHEYQWLNRRRVELLDEYGYAEDQEAWATYQESWQMRKYRVSEYIHRNLEPLYMARSKLEEGGYEGIIYQMLLSWSDNLDWKLPPYGDFAYFVGNGYMDQLTKKSEDGDLIGPIHGAEGYIWSQEYTIERMNGFLELGGEYTWERTKYARVHEFVKECIATELIRK